jgi:predicted transcriptional regulator
MKDERLTIRINSDLKIKLEKLAANNKRKTNDYLHLLIEDAVKNKIKL